MFPPPQNTLTPYQQGSIIEQRLSAERSVTIRLLEEYLVKPKVNRETKTKMLEKFESVPPIATANIKHSQNPSKIS